MGRFMDRGWGLLGLGVEMVGLWIRGWGLLGLGVEMGRFMDQGVGIVRFRGGDG